MSTYLSTDERILRTWVDTKECCLNMFYFKILKEQKQIEQ